MKRVQIQRAFTLIELLIVVAIIAILAAIAVPNFLEAQVRSKVSRSKADIRSLATAIEAYATDNNAYPVDGHKQEGQAYWYVPGGPTTVGGVAGVTSPVAYITSVKLLDPFRLVEDASAAKNLDMPDSQYFDESDYRRYRYINHAYTYKGSAALEALKTTYEEVYGKWRLVGLGPDKGYNSDSTQVPNLLQLVGLNPIYDASNGTTSRGDIVRSQKHGDQQGPHAPGL